MAGDSQDEDLPSTELAETRDSTRTGSPSERIGPYRLLAKLGEGGMGEVWLAEQVRPVRRRVALKLIKQGMDTRQVIARFEAERQALALMSHSNVAKVFDAGATESGRPYFVMEQVAGVPLTQYCDEHRLSTRSRLELFAQACAGVEHANSRGIVHRDIKPSNILVAQEDGRPLVKLIDFGVAKAVAQRLTEKTLFTQYGSILGTPEYMSPEQAGISALDVDARTDVYSLGVVLYELLSGALPFESDRLRRAGHADVQRILREERPVAPSARVSKSSSSSSKRALRRGSDPGALRRELRGDLDRVVLRALEKDPAERYPSAAELSNDLGRYLSGQPVVAGPRRLWNLTFPQIGALLLLATLVGACGLSFAIWPVTAGVERRGLDLLFRLRGPRRPPGNVCVVSMDEASYQALSLDPRNRLPRTRHAELLDALTREGARAVAFDVLFVRGDDPDQDAALARAIATSGRVVLGSGASETMPLRPWEDFADAAAAVADVRLERDLDGAIRTTPLMSDGDPTLALAAYELSTGEGPGREGGRHVIDFYGPARTIPTVSLHQALEPRTYLPSGFFRDKIVFVGRSRSAAFWGDDDVARDTFGTPWSERAGGKLSGVEIHATVAANLLEGRRIVNTRPAPSCRFPPDRRGFPHHGGKPCQERRRRNSAMPSPASAVAASRRVAATRPIFVSRS